MNNKLKVDLRDVIEAIEFEGELLQHYYNKNTGVIMYIEDSSSATYKADDIHNLDNFEEWEKELILSLHDFRENPSDYIQLPSYDDINKYSMMIEFCNNIEDIINEYGGSISEEEKVNILLTVMKKYM